MFMTDIRRIYVPNTLLTIGALLCFADLVYAPRNSDPGPLVTAVLGILLLRRAITSARQPVAVILSGCILVTLMLTGNHGLLDGNKLAWIVVMLVAFACFGFWERIEKLWK